MPPKPLTRKRLGCANFAHGFAACGPADKQALRDGEGPNLAIVTTYNDMLSAHQPFERFPEIIKRIAREAGGSAQVAGGAPAMCDGVTQGEAGMELSLFSRDVIALSTAVALSHQMFDAAVYLGVCDKIVPGLLIGALSFGHLPAVFLPAGPMTSGLSNDEKSKTRQLFTEGKISRAALLEAEAQAYHGPGTCTFYGTANTNQMLMEIMGLHLPGASFVNPNTPLRDALTEAGVRRAMGLTAQGNSYTPIGHIVDERAVVNGVVGLHATGGSTNHTIHLIALAAAAGIALNWDDFADHAEVTPLLTRIYPNGNADVTHYQAAGGMPVLIRSLLSAGLLHQDVRTVWGEGLADYVAEPGLGEDGQIVWREAASKSHDETVLRGAEHPFQNTGGLRVLDGPLGRAVIKTSAVASERHVIEAPARVFHSQEELHAAFKAGELFRDCVAVVRFQGPSANGMPELHKLMPPLGILQDRGFKRRLGDRRTPVGNRLEARFPPRFMSRRRQPTAARSPRSAMATSSASTRPTAGSKCSSTRPNGRRGPTKAMICPTRIPASGATFSPPSARPSAAPIRAPRSSLCTPECLALSSSDGARRRRTPLLFVPTSAALSPGR